MNILERAGELRRQVIHVDVKPVEKIIAQRRALRKALEAKKLELLVRLPKLIMRIDDSNGWRNFEKEWVPSYSEAYQGDRITTEPDFLRPEITLVLFNNRWRLKLPPDNPSLPTFKYLQGLPVAS